MNMRTPNLTLDTCKVRMKVLLSSPASWVIFGAFLLRAFSAATRCVVNPDGAQYLYQASAIFNLQWSNLLSCKLSYISPFPIIIAPVYAIVRDWIVAGQVVNVLFGTITLIPLYHLLRRFTDRTVSTLTLLVFGLIPVFVEGSGNLLRGPIFWFLICMGMLMFVRQRDNGISKRRLNYNLLLSGLFFLLATWTRIEGVVFLATTPVYLVFSKGDRKLKSIVWFLAPLILAGILVFGTALATGKDIGSTLRIRQLVSESTQFIAKYEDLNSQLDKPPSVQSRNHMRFLHRVREVLPFIPLVAIFHNVIEGVFYPFALVYFLGFIGLRKRLSEDQNIRYLLWLSLAALVVLYLHMINNWVMAYRFLSILIFPSCAIFANGITNIIGYFQSRRRWQPGSAVVAIAAFLLLLGVPKSLRPEEQDKVVYRQAADVFVQASIKDQPPAASAVKASRGFEWMLLYAHRRADALSCAKGLIRSVPSSYGRFVAKLDKAGAQFFFYEKRYWPKERFDLLKSPYQKDFEILGDWQHPDSSRLILLKRKQIARSSI
jgi:hypothetical protein